jgi:hypothetical protein
MRNLILILSSFILFSADGPKLSKVKITEGVTASLPKDFSPMSDNDIAQRYPSTKKPLAMYVSLDRTVDFGLNVNKSIWGGSDLNVLKKVYKSTILDLYNNVEFIQENIQNINERDYIVFEFTSNAEGTRKYTYLQYIVIGNRIYLFNFTSGAEVKDKWQPIAAAIMQSININAKKLKETVTVSQPVHKGKTPVQVLEEQKKNKTK